jgi:threonine/homoserine/homoserine lactone efflux protein
MRAVYAGRGAIVHAVGLAGIRCELIQSTIQSHFLTARGIFTINIELLISIFLFAITAAITPGPNNVMLMSSGVNFGIRRSLPLFLGVVIGFPVMVVAIGLGFELVFRAWPGLHDVITVVGVLYLLYLAWRIARSDKPEQEKGAGRPITFIQSALFQWVNPKAWVMATGALAAFTTNAEGFTFQVLVIAAVFMASAIPSAAVWLVFGYALQKLLADPRWLHRFNISMALLLVLSIVPVVINFFR